MRQLVEFKYKDQYQRDGILFPIKVLEGEELSLYQSQFADLEKYYDGFLPRAAWPHLFFDWAYDLVAHPAILKVVEEILGSEIIVEASMYLNKYPGSAAHFPWHQDGHRLKPRAAKSTTVWLALSDSNSANGCMRVIPGTHAQERLKHEPVSDKGSMLKYGGQIIKNVDESKARNVVLKPGEISVHANNIIHGSLPNMADYKRSGFIIRYSTPACERKTPVLQVAGNTPCPHLEVITKTMTPVGLSPFEAHKRFVEKNG